ncbi:MAG: hypothetical protein IPO04_16045 [Cytophagaceae bacterium]|nr:hypothetical protein [Cytophagaceae bacterium]
MIFLYSKTLYWLYLNVGNLAVFFLLILTIYTIWNRNFVKEEYRAFYFLLIGYFSIEIFTALLPYFGVKNTIFINYLYSTFALVVSTIFYFRFLKLKKSISNIYLALIGVYIFGSLFQLYREPWPPTSPKLFPLKNLITLSLTLFTLKNLYNSPKVKTLTNEPIHWINLGFLLFNISNLILVPLFSAAIPISDDLAFIIGIISSLVDPIAYTLWAIGIYKLTKKPFRPVASLWP